MRPSIDVWRGAAASKRRAAALHPWAAVRAILATVALGWSGMGDAPAARAAETTLYGLISTGEVFASTDGGASWEVRGTLPVSDAAGLIAGEIPSDLTLVTTGGIVFRSDDAGFTWNATGTITARNVVDVNVCRDGSLVAITESGELYRANDDGATWNVVAALASPDLVSLTTLQNGDLYAITRTGDVVRSVDDGVSWIPAAAIPVSQAVDIRGLDDELHILAYTGEVYRSDDDGATWTPVGTLSHTGMCGLALTREGLAAATQEGEVAVSSDGITWSWTGTMNQVWVTALASDVTILTATPPVMSKPRAFLMTPRPNPGEGTKSTLFPVVLVDDATVELKLYDARGRQVARRPSQRLHGSGEHALVWNPGALASGIYFVRLTTATGAISTARWVVLK